MFLLILGKCMEKFLDYSFGKFEKEWGELFRLWDSVPAEQREDVLKEHYGM